MVASRLPLSIGFAIDLQLELIAEGVERENSGDLLACSVLSTHTGLDVKNMGALSSLVVTDRDVELARQTSRGLMWKAWQQRDRVTATLEYRALPLSEAVSKALGHPPGTVVMADWGDAVTAGFPGDNAELLSHLQERGIRERTCLMITDPDLVERSLRAGVGNPVAGPVGGRWGEGYYEPVRVDGRVRLLFDGVLPRRQQEQPGHLSVSNTSMGPTAVVQIGDVFTVIATSVPVAYSDPFAFRSAGVEPADYRIVLCKTVLQQRRHFAPVAVGFVQIGGNRFGDEVHPWRKRDTRSTYPARNFSDTEIRRLLGFEARER